MNSVVVRQEESLEVTCYVYLLNCCKEDWFSVLSVLENFFVTMKLQNLGIKKALSKRLQQVAIRTVRWYHPYESSDIARESNS